MIHYLIQVLSFQLVFLLVYELLLRKQTFFNWNRFYLLGTSLLSLLLPFMKIGLFTSVSEGFGVVALPEVLLGSAPEISEISQSAMQTAGIPLEEASLPFWQLLLLSGSFLFGLWFLMNYTRLVLLRMNNPKRWDKNVLIISLKDSFHAFSFFNTIYLGTNINDQDRRMIVEHEMVHVKQWHSLDIIWFQLLRIAFWFNPTIYWYQKRMVELHEYIADDQVVQHQGSSSYYENLLRQVLQVNSLSLSNSFFSRSLVKKRIQMLHQSKATPRHLWRYLAIVPAVVMMLAYVSCKKETLDTFNNSDLNLEQYSYTIDIASEGSPMPPATKDIHHKFEAFLRSNTDYVGWGEIDSDKKSVAYSIHHKDETPDFEFYEGEVGFPDGTGYIILSNFTIFSKDFGIKNQENENDKEESEIVNFEIESINTKEVPFALIDQVPAFESCAHLTGEERKQCTSMEVAKFVNKNFDTDLALRLNLSGRQRISVYFKIDKEGMVTDIGARAPHPALEEEAKRIISKLPQFIPGRHNGEVVVVPYSLPILFQVND